MEGAAACLGYVMQDQPLQHIPESQRARWHAVLSPLCLNINCSHPFECGPGREHAGE